MIRRDFLRYTVSGLLASTMGGCASVASRSSTRKPIARRPNILICIADDASFPHMGVEGCSWVKTPGFDRVAQDGIRFTRAYTPNAKCAPSRSCILTGRNSWQLEAAANHIPYFPAKFKTYTEVLTENGYHTGYTAKGWAPGNPGTLEGRPRELTGKAYNKKKTIPPAKYISQIDYAANFEDFLEEKADDQPFCFWYGGTEPHRPYEFQAGIDKGGKTIHEIDQVPSYWPDNETVRTDMLDYAFEIEYFDRHVQTMLDMLEERNELDNTIVIVTADNGMPFPRIKGQEYEYSNHLPLAIMWKEGIKNPGRVVDDFVNFIDFAPTFLEVAKIDEKASGMQEIEGRSLMDIFSSPGSGIVNRQRDHALIGKERHDIGRPHDEGYPIRGIVKGDFLYIRNYEPIRWPAGNPETGYLNCDGSPTKTLLIQSRKQPETHDYWRWSFGKRPSEELYNIHNDPDCMKNLADDLYFRDVKSSMEKQMTDELKSQGDPRMFGRGAIFDEYPYADEKQRGFYERYMNGETMKTGWVNPSDYEKDFAEE